MVWLLSFGLAVSGRGDDLQIGINVLVRFATVEEGRGILERKDEFIAALTPFDRRVRLKSDAEVSERDFLAGVRQSARSWEAAEARQIRDILRADLDKLAGCERLFPTNIWFIKTSGEEEFDNAYTRQNAIVFPAIVLNGRPSALRHLVLHELFHIMSRHDPEFRRAIYAIIGFRKVNEVELPDGLRERKVTNPDGIENGWAIALTNRLEVIQAVPILLATGPTFDPNRGGDYFRLLAVQNDGGRWTPQLVDGIPRLLRVSQVAGWFEQIGRNTRYTIHPDEILADNFVAWVEGATNLPTPRIVTEMAEVLKRYGTWK